MSESSRKNAAGVILAIDAGGTQMKSALICGSGVVLKNTFRSAPSFSEGGKEQIFSAYAEIAGWAAGYCRASGKRITGVGIATPGPFDYARGVSGMTHKFAALKGVNLREEFYRRGIIPHGIPVAFTHDVHALLLGESREGALEGVRSAAGVTIGTGLGFGIIRDGKILDDGKGGPRVSIFNLPCRGKTLEDFVSSRGIAGRFAAGGPAGAPRIDVREIAGRALKKDPRAVRVFRDTGVILAENLAGILAEHGVQAVVFGGGIAKSFQLFGPSFKEAIEASGNRVAVSPARNIELSALKGASEQFLGAGG